MKLQLSGRKIPRNSVGDPQFLHLDSSTRTSGTPCVLDVFTREEVVELVNRCLYQLEYQQRAHAKRQREQTELLRPVKLAVRKLFNTSWTQATQDQINTALARLKEDPSLGEE